MYCPNCGEAQDESAKFCSACGARLARKPAAAPVAPPPAAPAPAAPVAAEADSGPPQPVKILDAGNRLMLIGTRAADVQKALDKYLGEGARVITSVCQVGKTWTAACTLPPKKKSMEDTQSLSLADLQQALAQAKPPEPSEEEAEMADDGCRIEEAGFKRLIYGPSKEAVERRLRHLQRFQGAQLVGEVEQVDSEWIAVCDIGGAGPGYRWGDKGPT